MKLLALNVCDWSHFDLLDIQLLEMYLCINLIEMSAVVLDTIFAVVNFENLSIATRIYASHLSSSRSGFAKCN